MPPGAESKGRHWSPTDKHLRRTEGQAFLCWAASRGDHRLESHGHFLRVAVTKGCEHRAAHVQAATLHDIRLLLNEPPVLSQDAWLTEDNTGLVEWRMLLPALPQKTTQANEYVKQRDTQKYTSKFSQQYSTFTPQIVSYHQNDHRANQSYIR
jgi:hypothetical protein